MQMHTYICYYFCILVPERSMHVYLQNTLQCPDPFDKASSFCTVSSESDKTFEILAVKALHFRNESTV